MRTVPSEGTDDHTEDFWANPQVGALIEQAENRQLSSDHAGALELLDQAVSVRGVDAAYAMAARAASLFELGRQVDARSQLDDLRKHKPFSAIAFHRAAEAAEMSGDQNLALRWFDMALSRCTDQVTLGERREAEAGPQIALLVFGRRRLRTSLGLPADELDRAGSPAQPAPDVAYPGELPSGVVTPEAIVGVLFWPRDQIVPAAARWPTLVQVSDIEAVVRQRELDNRQLVTEEGARIVMVPITVAELLEHADRTNGDPLDPVTRTKALHERYDQGSGIPWPPGRNDSCWCGSGRKYKKCCGAAGLA